MAIKMSERSRSLDIGYMFNILLIATITTSIHPYMLTSIQEESRTQTGGMAPNER